VKTRQGKLRQQRNRALARSAPITAHPDHGVESSVYQRAGMKPVARQRAVRLALRAMVGTGTIRVRNCYLILLKGTCEPV